MKKIYKVTNIYQGYVIANDSKDAEIRFNNDEEFYSTDYIESEVVDVQEVIDQLYYDLRNDGVL